MDVIITPQSARRLATVRHVGPHNQIPTAFERIGQLLGAAGPRLQREGSEMIAIYWDDPDAVPVEELRSDAAVVVPENFSLPGGLVEQRLKAGPYACTIHVGPTSVSETRGRGSSVSGPRFAQLLGHTKVDTTLNVYTQVLDGALRAAATKVGDELFTIVHNPKEPKPVSC